MVSTGRLVARGGRTTDPNLYGCTRTLVVRIITIMKGTPTELELVNGSKERIVAAALKLFGERGFERSTVRAICDEAGVNPGLVPYYFRGGKEELWRAAAADAIGAALAEVQVELTMVAEASLRHQTEVTLRAIARSAARHPELYRFIQSAADGASGERHDWMVESYTRPAYELLKALFDRARAAGVVPDVDTPVLIYMVLGAATHQYVLHREVEKVAGVDPFSADAVERHADALIATFVRGSAEGET